MIKRSNIKEIICIILMLFVFCSCTSGDTGLKTIEGRVLDGVTGKPIKGAVITAGNNESLTGDNGTFSMNVTVNTVGVRACGYSRKLIPVVNSTVGKSFKIRLAPFTAKALYLTYYGIGDRTLRGNAMDLIERTELNSLVIDVKGDRGVRTYKSDIPMVSTIGAQKLVIVKDIRALLGSLREKGIYTIARIVVFKDDVLGRARPDLTVKDADGKTWRDKEDLLWVDPSSKEVWDYNINIAEEAARVGFDEIQFDYVRFPDQKGLKFAVENTEDKRVKNISGFLKEARRRLVSYNVFLSADIFGYVAWNTNDTFIGQRLDAVAPYVDYISLMLYPSGFQFGIPGYRNPVAHPHEIVSHTLNRARERTNLSPLCFRPWLQAFRDYAFDRRHFNGPEIKTQINAAESFGSGGWMLWNPRNSYISDGLKMKTHSELIADRQ